MDLQERIENSDIRISTDTTDYQDGVLAGYQPGVANATGVAGVANAHGTGLGSPVSASGTGVGSPVAASGSRVGNPVSALAREVYDGVLAGLSVREKMSVPVAGIGGTGVIDDGNHGVIYQDGHKVDGVVEGNDYDCRKTL